MITKGGDTDTNAAIVGGLIGAADGLTKIPSLYTAQMLNCNPGKGTVDRPDKLCPLKCGLAKLIRKLYEIRPDDSVIVTKN